MAFDDLGDEPVEGAAAGGRLLQRGRTPRLLLERAIDGIELAADAADPIEQLLLVACTWEPDIAPVPPR
jgi:hypothetical protein